MSWDVFISHASEDKIEVVRPLFKLLTDAGLKVWIDETELTIGDSLRKNIDEGLAKSRYGIVILSPQFFAKDWPQWELDGLSSREIGGRKVILPVWHNIKKDEIVKYSPLLAGKLAANTSNGLNQVALDIIKVIKPTGYVSIKEKGLNKIENKKSIGTLNLLEKNKLLVVSSILVFIFIILFYLYKEYSEKNEVNIKLIDFTVNDSISRYELHRFEKNKEVFDEAFDQINIDNSVEAYSKKFKNWKEFVEYKNEIRSNYNYEGFNIFSSLGISTTEVPIMIDIRRPDFMKDNQLDSLLKTKSTDLFTNFILQNEYSKSIILKSIELEVISVYPLLEYGDTEILYPMKGYNLKIKSKKGNYILPLKPPIKIAADDAINIGVSLSSFNKSSTKTGKFLLCQFRIVSTINTVKTDKFLLYFED